MKTNPSFRIFKPSTLVSLGIAIAAALVTQPMRATAIPPSLVITENSSTSLTAMLTTSSGTTSLNVTGSADNWTIDLAGVSGNQQFWQEPETAARVFNFVNFDPASPNQLTVISEQGAPAIAGVADGTTDKTEFTLNGSELDVTFHDNGDVAAAPDTGSTLGLLSLSVVALLGATRLRFLQLAA
jgi:hypothetical protein